MRHARSLVVGAVLLLAAQGGFARPRATAAAGASVTILQAAAAKLDVPSTIVVTGAGPHWVRLGNIPREGALSLLPNEESGRVGAAGPFRLRLTPAGAMLEVDAPRLERASLPLEVTYHQY